MKNIFTLFTILFLGLSLASCKNKSAANSSNNLFVYLTTDELVGQRLIQGFEKETGIHVEFVRLSTGEATARMEAEKNNPQASLWLGGGALGHAEAKQKGLTIPYESPAAASIPAAYKDPEKHWTGIYVGVMAFVSNNDQLKKSGLTAPTSWKDLTDPKWKGHIQIPNPGTSGTTYNMITTLIKNYGEAEAFEYLKKLHQNISQYTRSGQAPAKNVALGESIVGIGYMQDLARLVFETKAPVTITYPSEGTGYEVGASSLIKGGKNLEAAKKLYDWIYSKTAAQIMADNFIVPLVNNGVKVNPQSETPKTVKMIDTDIDWAGKNRQRLIDTWNEKING